MLIEVIKLQDAPNTEKGNLLEELAEEFLKTQGYEVLRQVRVTAAELDLLCKHKVSAKEVYVECKAHKEPLSANDLKNLLGTVDLKEYAEGWFVSTGPLGKDAKGFMTEWEKKSLEKRERLIIYTPDRVLTALLDAKVITPQSKEKAAELIREPGLSMGDWVLLITPWGKYWVCTILRNGIPKSAILFCAQSGCQVSDPDIFEKIKSSDFSLKDFEFLSFESPRQSIEKIAHQKDTAIVEVEFGEKWRDYRPARPEHFVGRKKAQKELLHFFTEVKKCKTNSRIFAIKGDSGIGKSSLVAKMRDMAKESHKPNNLFLYAVDMRAANDASYISSALMKALKSAASQGFGHQNDLEISNYTDPLQSESISAFLYECKRKHQLIIIVFDQFEELYSKSELFAVFEEAKRLMFSAISASSNLVLGFAWKTDSTVPQDHPAYHMWHQLSDHRFEVSLKPFSHSDAEQSLNIFGTELGEKILPELRKYLLENSQGYPWLLKKLCIHFYEQLQNGVNQHQMANRSLDISSLFEQDLNSLTPPEMGCLKLVAKNAPMDWYEVLENAGHEVVQSLQNKRLLIRRGDKLNLYWDIFRDYVLYGSIPSIPFTYIPQSPSLDALLRVSLELDDAEGKSIQQLADGSKLQESTVRNIIHDLEQFGVISIADSQITIDNHLSDLDVRSILSNIRILFKRHALTELLKKSNTVTPADTEQLIVYLKLINPTAQYHIRTWTTYANRMVVWLQAVGLICRESDGIRYKDFGDIYDGDVKKWSGERKRIVFLGDTSPAKVIEAFDLLKQGARSHISMKNLGYRNACAVLYRFRLIELTSASEYRVPECAICSSSIKAIWEEAGKEESIKLAISALTENPLLSPEQIGEYVAKSFKRDWKPASRKRVGNSLRQWGAWLMTPLRSDSSIPDPPGRKTLEYDAQPSFF